MSSAECCIFHDTSIIGRGNIFVLVLYIAAGGRELNEKNVEDFLLSLAVLLCFYLFIFFCAEKLICPSFACSKRSCKTISIRRESDSNPSF